jgi:hypothetical protein
VTCGCWVAGHSKPKPTPNTQIIVTTVPLVYPHLTTSERVLELAQRLSNVPAVYRWRHLRAFETVLTRGSAGSGRRLATGHSRMLQPVLTSI